MKKIIIIICLAVAIGFVGWYVTLEREGYIIGGYCFNERRVIEADDNIKPKGNESKEEIKYQVRVRSGGPGPCDNEYMWLELVSRLLADEKKNGAIVVLGEMYERKMEIETDSSWRVDINDFMKSEYFKASEVGKKIETDRSKAFKRHQKAIDKIKAMDEKELPPEYYINKEACPGERCLFGTWDVRKDMKLFDTPNGNTVIGSISKGEEVSAITGEMHLKPVPVVVVYPVTIGWSQKVQLKEGDVFFILDYVGEGLYNFWYKGLIDEDELYDIKDYCRFPRNRCWLEYVYPKSEMQDTVWWVKIKTKDGIEGWSNGFENVHNINAHL
ncbi:MAG: hypothetical protein KAR06_00520 [Deltaproteobacteria bacterium]|nr:hypothetical protein [Deltaproteobacteria bacterium]